MNNHRFEIYIMYNSTPVVLHGFANAKNSLTRNVNYLKEVMQEFPDSYLGCYIKVKDNKLGTEEKINVF